VKSETQQAKTERELERAHVAGSPSADGDGNVRATPVFLPDPPLGHWHLRLTIVVLAVVSLDLLWLIWIGYGAYGLLAS
jgi:hypothetical protein